MIFYLDFHKKFKTQNTQNLNIYIPNQIFKNMKNQNRSQNLYNFLATILLGLSFIGLLLIATFTILSTILNFF